MSVIIMSECEEGIHSSIDESDKAKNRIKRIAVAENLEVPRNK